MLAITLLIMLSARSCAVCGEEKSAQYLLETIESLKMKTTPNTIVPIKRTYADFSAEENRGAPKVESAKVPTLHLTKSELAEMYESALTKGETIKLDPGDGSPNHITAAVHEIDVGASTKKGVKAPNENGFYYYYYPLKSFVDELTSSGGVRQENVKQQANYVTQRPPMSYYVPSPGKESHIYSHMHQHNVHIEPMKHAMEYEKKKGMEPLFMAISGFIGMTVMFVLSMLVLPKFNKLKPKGFHEDAQDHLIGLTRVAMEAIEGYDCSERMLCESAKAAKAFHLHNTRVVKLVRRVAPKTVVRNIDKIRKYTDKKYKCAAIACKPK